MVSNEQPSISQPERQPRPAEQPSSGTVQKSLKERIAEIIAKNGEIEDLKELHNKGGSKEKYEQMYKKKRELGKDVRIILTQIQRGTSPQDQIYLSPIARTILNEIDVSKIGNDSAPVVYEFLRYASSTDPSHNLETMEGTMGMIRSMTKIADFETRIAQNILRKLVGYAKSKEWSGEDLERAKEYLKPTLISKQELSKRRKERSNHFDEIFAPIKDLEFTEQAKNELRRKTIESLKLRIDQGSIDDEQVEKQYKKILTIETEHMQDELIGLLNGIILSGGSSRESSQARERYNAALRGFEKEGFISSSDYSRLKELPDSQAAEEYKENEWRKSEGSDIVGEALRVFVPTQEQVRLLRAIASPESLKNFFYSETDKKSNQLRYIKNDKVEWKIFYEDMKGIFEELLSIADRNSNQFFEQAFNPMYEGHLYQLLLKRINNLGSQISVSEDEWLNLQEIKIEQPTNDPSLSNSEAPYKTVVKTKTTTISLGVAIGNYFANNMTDLLHVRENLHNINSICFQGLGWEQLSQYAERMSLAKFDWIIRQEPELSLAYNLFMTNLQQELSANRGVVSTQFGKADEVWQLNSVELKAFLQMKSYLKSHYPELENNESALNQKAMQKIRMASAIASGITGEFWNTMLTAKMPLNTEKTIDGEGEKVDKIANTYGGTHHRGYEKMIGQLDLDLVLERFGLPKYYNSIRYTPRFGDMKHPPGAYSKEGYFDHGIVYRAKFLIEDAIQNGRSDELAKFDETYVTFAENMRTVCVGLFARGGWRFAQWETFKAYKEGTDFKKMDYTKTLKNVKEAGSYIVKQFIDNTLSEAIVPTLSKEEVEMLSGIRGLRGDQLSKQQIKEFKKTAYAHLIFGQIKQVAPTKFLQFENRRWTPKGEPLLRDGLMAYLKSELPEYRKGILETHVYTMYVSALSLLEKEVWETNKKEGKVEYTLGKEDIVAHQRELLDFFHNYKAEIGQYESYGDAISIIENDGKFLETLINFQKKLKEDINVTRYTLENRKGKPETLEQRFAEYLSAPKTSSKSYPVNLIGGEDLDLTKFYFSGSGGFSTTRMIGETFGVAGKVNPALAEIINEALPKFVRGKYKDIDELEKAVKEIFLPLFKKIQAPIAAMDKDQADEYMIGLALFISNMVGKDRILRIKGIGPAIDFWRRQRYSTTQSSVMQDFFRNDLKNPSTSLDSDEIYAFMHILLNGTGVPPHEEIPDHYETTLSIAGRPIITRRVNAGESYETKKLFGPITYKKKVIDHSKQQKFSIEDAEKCAGVVGKVKWIETYVPAIAAGLVAILLAMAYLANQKNKKK